MKVTKLPTSHRGKNDKSLMWAKTRGARHKDPARASTKGVHNVAIKREAQNILNGMHLGNDNENQIVAKRSKANVTLEAKIRRYLANPGDLSDPNSKASLDQQAMEMAQQMGIR